MQLLFPKFLALSLLAIVPIVLYLFRRKSKRIDVSTLVFFKSLAQEHQESAWLRRLKKLLSFLLTLAILMGAVLALTKLVFSPRSEDTRTIVVLLDRSASMAVADAEEVSRLDAAKEEIKSRLDAVPEDVGVTLIAYDRRPEIVQPRTLNRRELLSRLDQIEVRPVSQDEEAAIESAITLAQLETPAVVWHASDHAISGGTEETDDGATAADDGADEQGEDGPPESDGAMAKRLAVDLPEGVALEFFDFALADPVNVGFTAFQVRRVPLVHSKFEVFVRVALNQAAPEPVTARLEVGISGLAPLQLRDIELQPGGSEELVVPIEGVEDQLLHLKLRIANDALATDNDILAPLPRSRPVVAAVISPQLDPFTEIALMAIQDQGELVMWKGAPDSWPLAEPVDVVVFDNWLPEEWPSDLPVVVINPPSDAGPIRVRPLAGGGVPYDSVRVSDENHPLLFRVSSSRVALTQTALYQVEGSLQPLWLAGNEPVMSAGEVSGQRMVVMGFSVAQSERLPLTASFPILMGNALLWCAESSRAASERIQENRTGDLIEIPNTKASEGDETASISENELTWTEWRDGQARNTPVEIENDLLELQRVGVWKISNGATGTSYLLSNEESNVPGAVPVTNDSSSGVAVEEPSSLVARKLFFGDVTWFIIGLVLLFLVVENWLFHRHAVY
jgi:hypothetical protein